MSTGENAITGTNTTPGTELNALGPSLENSSGGRSQVNADKRDDTSGINVVQQMDQNNVGKENAGSVEQGMTATKTRTGEGMKETLGLNGGKDSNTRENTDDGYIDEIKRRKFEKKAKSKLFVGGLVQDVREEFLHEKFEKYGEIVDGKCEMQWKTAIYVLLNH